MRKIILPFIVAVIAAVTLATCANPGARPEEAVTVEKNTRLKIRFSPRVNAAEKQLLVCVIVAESSTLLCITPEEFASMKAQADEQGQPAIPQARKYPAI